MEPRKAVLMNLRAGQEQTQTGGHSRGRRQRDELRQQHWYTHTAVCRTDGQGEAAGWHGGPTGLRGALWRPGGRGCAGGGRLEREGTRIWFKLLYGGSQHNIVKQSSSNWKQIFKKERYINKPMPPTYPHNTFTNKQITIVSQFLQNIGYFGVFSSK